METKNTRADFNIFDGEYQVCIPLNIKVNIPTGHKVRVLHAVMERMDWSVFEACYSRYGRIGYPPRVLTELLVYGYMDNTYSSRMIETACRENIIYMFLLDGHKAPDHNTIARFRSKHFARVGEQILCQMVNLLIEMGEISMAAVFIDGTKLEANANRYTFVWRKRVEKQKAALEEKMKKELPGLLDKLEVKFRMPDEVDVHHLKKLFSQLEEKKKQDGVEFVHGTGKRRSRLQRAYEQVEEWLKRMRGYQKDLKICGERNSYSKTDHDATFMRMKEDHMRNGQLKPGYNINVATACEYIIGSYVSADRTDTKTLIPFVAKIRRNGWEFERVVVDAGYESEENYCYFEQPWIHSRLLVKPTNHEQKKSRKYKADISRRENMSYDANLDAYTCANGKQLTVSGVRHTRSSSGFPIETTVYTCAECKGCPLKDKCIKGKSKIPMDERSKNIYVSKRFQEQRAKMETQVDTKMGKLLRVNRSIQAEGTFAMTKEDMKFRRLLLRGTAKVAAEWTLMSMAYNILKLFHKARTGRLGTHIVVPGSFLESAS